MLFFLVLLPIYLSKAMRDPPFPLQMNELAQCELAESKMFVKKLEERGEKIEENKETITYERYVDVAIELICDFLLLSKESRNELLKLHRMEDSTVWPKELPNESDNDKAIREAVKSVNWLENPEELFVFVEEKGESIRVMKDMFEMAKHQFDQLTSEDSKKFIREIFESLYESREKLAITEEMADHYLSKFNSFSVEIRKDVLTKMANQYLDIYLRMYYDMCGFGKSGKQARRW